MSKFKIDRYEIDLGYLSNMTLMGKISCYGTKPKEQYLKIFFDRTIDSVKPDNNVDLTGTFTAPSSDMASYVDILRSEKDAYVIISSKGFWVSTDANLRI